jgi:hypothetical protein
MKPFRFMSAVAAAVAVFVSTASPAAAACPSGQYTISLFNDTFETSSSYSNWWLSGNATGGWWQVGNPDWTWDSGGYKQLGSTPSEQLDPRVFPHGPNALITGRGGNPVDAYDLDGFSRVDSKNITFPSDRASFIDLYYYFAHDWRANANDFLKIHFIDLTRGFLGGANYGGAINTLAEEHGYAMNRNAGWVKRTWNMDAYGMRGRVGKFVIEASNPTAAVVEAAIEDVNVYYCW